MPQTIWEDREAVHPPPQYVTPQTDTWAYIGATIKTGAAKAKAMVWNAPDPNSWIHLNGEYTPVIYVVTPEWNKITISIRSPKRDDIVQYWVQIDNNADFSSPIENGKYPFADPAVGVFTAGVLPDTTYYFNVRAEYQMAGEGEGVDTVPEWSPDSLQTHKTPQNPVPTPPLNLRSPNRGNTWIDLAWDASANGQASRYQVFSRVGLTGSISLRAVTALKAIRISGLLQDTKYQWWIVAINDASGKQSPPSNVLRWATGHEAVNRTGSIDSEKLEPSEWGSWRPDIGWLDWHVYPGTKKVHKWVYQGYWPGPNNTGPTTANTSERERNGRYKGIVRYDAEGFRNRLNARFGYDVGGGFGRGQVTVTKVEIRRPYRQRQPGNMDGQWMKWWLAYANVGGGGEPKLRVSHINNGKDDADHVDSQHYFKAGYYKNYLRLPRSFGRALVQGWYEDTGSPVNSVGLYRSDNEHNGYGTAGYARFAGHGMHDDMRGYTDNSSDWTIHIDAHWTIQTVAYQAPYQW